MVIGQDSVVTLHYTLKGDDGKVIDQSSPDEPLAYLHGHGNIVPGLERELTGRDLAALDELRQAEAVVPVILGEGPRGSRGGYGHRVLCVGERTEDGRAQWAEGRG